MCSLFSVLTLFYLILENMTTYVRKCLFSFIVTSCIISPFLCCHLLNLIIYLLPTNSKSFNPYLLESSFFLEKTLHRAHDVGKLPGDSTKFSNSPSNSQLCKWFLTGVPIQNLFVQGLNKINCERFSVCFEAK